MIKIGLDKFINACPSNLQGMTIALVAHPASTTLVAGQRKHAVEILQNNSSLNLIRLFGPEHGLYGHAIEGQKIADGLDQVSGLPVISLYGNRRAPEPEHLVDIDALFFDLQDIGVRCFTYISTLKYCMQALKDANKKLVILDRPNPLGRGVYGGLVEDGFESFVSKVNIPFVHGLTMAEVALFLAKEMSFDNLIIVKMENWQGQSWDKTGLKWQTPSPSISSFEIAKAYPITVFLEGTNLSEGRGTDLAFLQFGASWLNNSDLAAFLNSKDLTVEFIETSFTPKRSKFANEQVNGLSLNILRDYNPLEVVFWILHGIEKFNSSKLEFLKSQDRYFIDLLFGSSLLREAIIADKWQSLAVDFQPELIY